MNATKKAAGKKAGGRAIHDLAGAIEDTRRRLEAGGANELQTKARAALDDGTVDVYRATIAAAHGVRLTRAQAREQIAEREAAREQARIKQEAAQAAEMRAEQLKSNKEKINDLLKKLAYLRDFIERTDEDEVAQRILAHASLSEIGRELEGILFAEGLFDGFGFGGRAKTTEGWFSEVLKRK